MSLELPDREARNTALTEFVKPVLVEAGAGTGKTALLTARVLIWALGRGWELAEHALPHSGKDPDVVARRIWARILALTFTEAAAAEMAYRIQEVLKEIVSHGCLPSWLPPTPFPDSAVLSLRARHLLSYCAGFRARTFHGWAYDLLREHGIRIGLSPNLVVDADGSKTRDLIERVVTRDWSQQIAVCTPEQIRCFARYKVSPQKIAFWLQELFSLGVPVPALKQDFYSSGRIARWLGRLQQMTENLSSRFASIKFRKNETRAIRARELLERLLVLLSELQPDRSGWSKLRMALEGDLAELPRTLQSLSRSQPSSTLVALFSEDPKVRFQIRDLEYFLKRIPPADPEALDSLLAIVQPLAQRVDQVLRQNGIATFGNLLLWAEELLENPEVLWLVRAELDQVVVDELQDTDVLQLQLLEKMWSPHRDMPQPGAFGVGDPKQSIYGWRRARLPAYQSFARSLLQDNRPLQLIANFRSAEGLLDEVARVLGPVMRENNEVAVPFVPLEATGSRRGQTGLVEYWIHLDEGLRAHQRRWLEAEAIAADLAELLRASSSTPSIGILFRSTTGFEPYLDALRRWGIPYAVSKDRNYYRRREVLDAISVLCAILDPADRLSLLATLRSSAGGIPDAVLHALIEEGLFELNRTRTNMNNETARAIEELVQAAKRRLASTKSFQLFQRPDWFSLAQARLQALFSLREAIKTLPPGVWLDRVRERFPLELVAAGRYFASYRLANLESFFWEAEAWLQEHRDSLEWLVHLKRLARERPDRPEAPASQPQDSVPVQVLTWHGAKGLEFDIVYLPDLLGQQRQQESSQFLAELVEGRWELQFETLSTPGVVEGLEVLRRIQEAEAIRLLYVAMTRARQRLVFCGVGAAAEPVPAAHLWERVREARQKLLFQEEPAGGVFDDPPGVRWRGLRLPREGAASTPSLARKRHSPPPTPREVATQLVRWREAQAARQARQDRPLFSAMARRSEAETEPAFPAVEGTLGSSREEAQAAGTALHAACEWVDLFVKDPDRWLARVRAKFRAALPPKTPFESAWLGFEERLTRLTGSRLWRQLMALQSQVLARELPVALPCFSESPSDPLLGYLGWIDLVVQEPDGPLRIVDFKTDQVRSEAAFQERVKLYKEQLRHYREALTRAFELKTPPRAELWFLELDRIVPLFELEH
jgi:ATP-dependent exoDNAse (exonuclease V) beta subunit